MYCYVWSYVVRPDSEPQFLSAYGPEGDWARFFRRDSQYIRTHLLCDRSQKSRFMTIDFWKSYDAWASFRERNAEEFEALDKAFEQFTVEEVHIGSFDAL